MTYVELDLYEINNSTRILKYVLDLIPDSKTKRRRSWKPFRNSDVASGELNKSLHKYRRANSSVEQAAGGW